MTELPKLNLGAPDQSPAEMHRLLAEAFTAYAHRQTQKTAAALAAAETAARKANLHREAAQIRKAITILAHGGKPRLLTRPNHLNARNQNP